MTKSPQRIICMTEETTETIYLLGEQQRIVGISGYTVRPPRARKEKPRISAFTRANIPKILALNPDLVLGFSDMQADIASDLVKAGLQVHIFNQRTVNGIFDMIDMLGRVLDVKSKSELLINTLKHEMTLIKNNGATSSPKPRIYFEEWNEPLISGIGWVSELIEIAGGTDCYAELAGCAAAKDRIIKNPDDVINKNPDIIIGSWCGKHLRPEQITARPGWSAINAVKNNHIYEIKSAKILQPGPAALSDGLKEINDIVINWQQENKNTAV